MTCYHPLKAYRPRSLIDGGRYVFDATKALNPDHPVMIPCGRCHACRSDRVTDWKTRLTHEAQMHHASSFITLTYDDDNLPPDFSVDSLVAAKFIRALRKKLDTKIRFFIVGEYGEQTFRPHYHALIYGYDFSHDRKLYKKTKAGPLFTSDLLTSTWGRGHATVGQVTPSSAAYCAAYIIDKRGGDEAANRYVRQHPVTSEIVTCKPEFANMSSRPGLGRSWFDKFKSSVFPSDFLIVDGKQVPVPRYYFKLLEEEEQHRLKLDRLPQPYENTFARRKWNKSPERLAVRETLHKERLKRRKSSL